MTKQIIFLSIVLMFTTTISAQKSQDLIFGDAQDYAQQVHNDYLQRSAIPKVARDGIDALARHRDIDIAINQRNALEFLYAYMPQSDLVDYNFEFFCQQAAIAIEARHTFSWGATIPADIFRHFVLVHRVNNEDLDTARAYIFHQLKDRIRNMSMYEAALEVNHWCHEHVDYQPADMRTSAPLATLRTSHGRCGEESTLTVTALRAVGIPARQCYTPRWAHCDDNHAWVEVWVDGKWYFLGACEPDPELNMGWFAMPSSRTMMVHTNVFGKYNGPEEVNKQTPYYSCINVLPNYAETLRLTITVVDEKGDPVPDATVQFKLYNYAEYYTLVSRQTNILGQASIITGKGDLLIWVNKGDQYNYAKIDGRTQNSIIIPLDGQHNGKRYTENFEMCPPSGGAQLTQTTPERQERNEQRKQYEDSLREAYRNTFPTPASLAGYHNGNFSDEQLYDIIHRSEGNYREIMKFLDNHQMANPHYLIPEYIAALSDKDLRDVSAETLEAQLEYFNNQWPREIFVKGILPARISNELLRPDRNILNNNHQHLFQTTPSILQLCAYVDSNFVVDPNCNYYNCPISPMGVLTGHTADAHSLGIFFVALCRALGVPAYMDNSNGELYAWESGNWQNVQLKAINGKPSQETASAELCTLMLHNPNHYVYYPNYTIQRFENGEYISYDFENDSRVETDPIILQVPAGHYCLSTGSRYSNGDVLSQMEFFNIPEKSSVEKTITIRPLTPREQNYGHIDVDQTLVNGRSLQSYLTQSGQKHLILCLITPGTEPVNHLIKELEAKQKAYENWNGPILFIAQNSNWKPNKKLPHNLICTQDKYEPIFKKVLNGLVDKQEGHNPICIILDQNGTIRFYSEGYHIGLGELMIEQVTNSK